jgi:diguanylate cyclase (GGDEF)-like protein
MDHFKRYNDVYGHQQGDDCLSTVASVVQSAAQRPRDVVCRYGGEELVMLLPETDLRGATALAEQVLQRVRALALPHLANGKSIVTLSAGVASVRPETGIHADNLLQCADRALYQAKSQGRDQVVQAAPEDCSAPQS